MLYCIPNPLDICTFLLKGLTILCMNQLYIFHLLLRCLLPLICFVGKMASEFESPHYLCAAFLFVYSIHDSVNQEASMQCVDITLDRASKKYVWKMLFYFHPMKKFTQWHHRKKLLYHEFLLCLLNDFTLMFLCTHWLLPKLMKRGINS